MTTRVKICGLTNLADARCAAEAGADLLGFIFYPPSPRAIDPLAAREIVAAIKSDFPAITCVGVFVNEIPAYMTAILDQAGLDLAQLSGNEPLDSHRAMDGRGYKVMRGKRWADEGAAWQAALLNHPNSRMDRPDLLLEADHDSLYGGTGTRADESVAVRLAGDYRLLLAGGLTSANVAEIIQRVRPWGVDVASGVEASPGRKDHDQVRAFVAAARSMDRQD